MIDPTRLRALLSDHPPQAFHQKDQAAIRDVWDAARAMLDAVDAMKAVSRWDPGYDHYPDDEQPDGEWIRVADVPALLRPDTNTNPATEE